MVLSVFRIRNEGNEYREEDGHIQLASMFFLINVCHALWNVHGHE